MSVVGFSPSYLVSYVGKRSKEAPVGRCAGSSIVRRQLTQCFNRSCKLNLLCSIYRQCAPWTPACCSHCHRCVLMGAFLCLWATTFVLSSRSSLEEVRAIKRCCFLTLIPLFHTNTSFPRPCTPPFQAGSDWERMQVHPQKSASRRWFHYSCINEQKRRYK